MIRPSNFKSLQNNKYWLWGRSIVPIVLLSKKQLSGQDGIFYLTKILNR